MRTSRGTRIARVSELLVSQLLQPANVTPIKPQLAQQNLFIAQRAGPSHASFDEFASPVDRERPQAPSFGGRRAATASRATTLPWRGCTTACRTASATTGSRPTASATTTIWTSSTANAFLQYRPSRDTNLQAELRSTRMEHGDLRTFFDRDLYSDSLRGRRRRRLAAARRQAPTYAESHRARFVDRAGRAVERCSRETLSPCRRRKKPTASTSKTSLASAAQSCRAASSLPQQDAAVASTLFLPDVGPVVSNHRRDEPATRSLQLRNLEPCADACDHGRRQLRLDRARLRRKRTP